LSKRVVKNYVFDASTKKITLPDFDASFDLSRLDKVTNATRNVVIYNKKDAAKLGTNVGNVITLAYDTVAMSNSDVLLVEYEPLFGTENKFTQRSEILTGVQSTSETWVLSEDTEGTHIISEGGDSSGSSYLRLSLNPFVEANGLSLTSKESYDFPMRVVFGTSISQRVVGQEVFVGMVATNEGGDVEYLPSIPDKAITGTTASITSNVATLTLVNHGLKGGDRVVLFGCADHRMNVGPVAVTVLSQDTFTVPVVITNGTYSTVGGSVRLSDPMRYATNGAGLLFENATTTNASFVSRRSGTKFRSVNQTIASTNAAQTNTSPYTDAFNASGTQELYFSADEISYRSFASDSNAGISGSAKYSQAIPNEDKAYKVQIRARNLNGFSLPVGRVVSAVKTGTTTATITVDSPHGLIAGDFVQIYGTRDQTNFANLTTQTAIASVVSPTVFTVVWGSAVTASTAGGVVWTNQGQVAAPGAIGLAVQSISRTNNVLFVTGSTNWAGLLPGEYVNVYGLENNAKQYEGAFKVLRTATTTLELESVGPDFASLTTGGAVIKRTDVRIHYVRVLDYERKGVEILGGRGNTTDINNAAPVSIVGSASIAVNQSTGSAATIWNAAGYGGILANDIVSGAITGTATSGTITPGTVGNIGTYSHTFNVVVTAVTGTTPTMDVAIEESPDNGTNWIRVYEFPRITANGSYVSPKLRATYGTRFRYVRTLGGATPSFTMSLNRTMWSTPGELTRQWFDRSIVLTTLNSATPVYNVDGANLFQIVTNLGAATTAPVLQLQGSEDGTNWYALGATFTPVANSTIVNVVKDFVPKFARVIVATAGTAVTPGYISLKALGA
jgi:hypothetical protein